MQNTWPEDMYRSNPNLINKTAEITGVSRSSIYTVLKEYREKRAIEVKETTRKTGTIWEKLDDFTKSAIRGKVHTFFLEGQLSNLQKILQVINDDDMLPTFSKTTLWRVLNKLKFKFMTRNRKWRTKYLKEIEKHRNANHRIFYLDETWVNAGK